MFHSYISRQHASNPLNPCRNEFTESIIVIIIFIIILKAAPWATAQLFGGRGLFTHINMNDRRGMRSSSGQFYIIPTQFVYFDFLCELQQVYFCFCNVKNCQRASPALNSKGMTAFIAQEVNRLCLLPQCCKCFSLPVPSYENTKRKKTPLIHTFRLDTKIGPIDFIHSTRSNPTEEYFLLSMRIKCFNDSI